MTLPVDHGARLKGGYRSVTSTNAYPTTRLCHRITPSTNLKSPRGYRPNGWNVGGKVGMTAIRRSTGEVMPTSPRNAAVETDAYALDLPGKGKNYLPEKVLGVVESKAALALRSMLRSWPPSDEDRGRWSMLMAMQMTRGHDFRRTSNQIADYLLKTQISLSSRDPADMRQRLEDAGLEASDENLDLLREMMDKPDSYQWEVDPARLGVEALQLGLQLLPYLAVRTWNLVRDLLTSARGVRRPSLAHLRHPFLAVVRHLPSGS